MKDESKVQTLLDIFWKAAAETLDFRVFALFVETAGFGRDAGTGLLARLWRGSGQAEQVDQAQQGVGAVLVLRAVLARFDDQHAIAGQSAAGDRGQPRFDILREGEGMEGVEAQLNGGGDFVNVLTARA